MTAGPARNGAKVKKRVRIPVPARTMFAGTVERKVTSEQNVVELKDEKRHGQGRGLFETK